MVRHLMLLVLLLALSFAASADVLTFDYAVTPGSAGPGTFGYSFKVTNTGLPTGTQLGWMVFGDTVIPSPWDGYGQPPAGYGVGAFGVAPGGHWYDVDFYMTSAVPAPWTSMTATGGEHNGPTFSPVLGISWIPQLGDSFEWTGLSHHEAEDLSLAFLVVNGGGSPLIVQGYQQVPEPGTASTLLCAGLMFGAVTLMRRRLRPRIRHTLRP